MQELLRTSVAWGFFTHLFGPFLTFNLFPLRYFLYSRIVTPAIPVNLAENLLIYSHWNRRWCARCRNKQEAA